jgi:hypothetical protein
VSASGTVDAGSVTVTCQASERELRSAAVWLYLHDRAAQFAMLLIIVGAVALFGLWDRIIVSFSGLVQHPSWIMGRGVAAAIWLAVFIARRIWLLWTMPARAYRRMQMEGPTTLTVSSSGLSWYNSVRRGQAAWTQYAGYALVPDALIFLSSTPYVVPRTTLSPVDFERVLTIARRYLQPLTHFDSQKRLVSAASPAQ